MNIAEHPSTNLLLNPPPGMSNCVPMRVTRLINEGDQQVTMTSFWKPTDDELKILNEGGLVMLWVWGNGHPPVAVEVCSKP